jgi:hypothetical protein
MKRLLPALLLLALLAWTAPAQGGAVFSQPFVDVSPAQTSQNAMVAIWSSTDNYVTQNSAVTVLFPPDMAVPSGLSPSACNCIFMRHTSTSAGAWAASEITFTAGSINVSAHQATLNFPQALYPGKFYIRFDATANFYTPYYSGKATLGLSDPTGNTAVSKAFYINLSSSTAAATMGFISGTVKTSAGTAVSAALVFASNIGSGSYLPMSVSARRAWINPTGTTVNAYTTASGSDGGYMLSVPPGNYYMRAEIWNAKYGVANGNGQDAASTVTVTDGNTAQQSFTVSPLP